MRSMSSALRRFAARPLAAFAVGPSAPRRRAARETAAQACSAPLVRSAVQTLNSRVVGVARVVDKPDAAFDRDKQGCTQYGYIVSSVDLDLENSLTSFWTPALWKSSKSKVEAGQHTAQSIPELPPR